MLATLSSQLRCGFLLFTEGLCIGIGIRNTLFRSHNAACLSEAGNVLSQADWDPLLLQSSTKSLEHNVILTLRCR